MLTFTLRRLASGIGLLIVISALAYTLLFFSSSSIARNILGDQATPEQIALKEAELGLDQPLLVRYLGWVGAALQGDLGRSWFNGEPVTETIQSRLPVTLVLMIVSIVLVAVFAAVLGVLAAVRRGWVDQTVQVGAVIGDAIPGFVLAIFLVTIFAVNLGWFPAVATIRPGAGAEAWIVSLTLPVIAIVVNYVTSSAQQIRSAVIKELEKDYVRTLRSRGLSEREIVLKNVLRSAAPAGLTVLSLQFIGLLGGVIILEQVFAIPGIGALAVNATVLSDIPLVMGVVIITVVIVMIVNLLVDIAQGALNPKVRLS
ncbi:peptide/nickel transport system permease protein [Microbacterium sp. SLBN-154]|jgi:peptide/nickel transport system permease protein|uniref:ABC transporter permease n=1 Tax=Microbacterium sp. SLBN-154 TaxID=2768458 RepID=UPI0011547AE2|nr:ABC transporter permease [Microbacterium sp. SLBN-154]TQK20685.1 peptide/nickel transport system permease protein [Microbacterium sp. SLBN-154]